MNSASMNICVQVLILLGCIRGTGIFESYGDSTFYHLEQTALHSHLSPTCIHIPSRYWVLWVMVEFMLMSSTLESWALIYGFQIA